MQEFFDRIPSPAVKKLSRLRLILVVVLFVPVPLFLMHIGQNSDGPVSGGEPLGGGACTRYQGHIYTFSGDLVPGADAGSFSPLGLSDLYLGKDKNAVYCGAHVIAQLRPEQVRLVKDNYVSDGTRAWYCADEKNAPPSHWWQFFTRIRNDDKEYALTQLNPVNAANLKTAGVGYAQDGSHAFYEGTLIPGADGASLQTVTQVGENAGREDDNYASDHGRVYYQGIPLPGANPASFHTIEIDPQTDYGQDATTGQ